MAQRYRPRHIMRNKRLPHTVTPSTLKRHSEKAGKVNTEVVKEEELGLWGGGFCFVSDLFCSAGLVPYQDLSRALISSLKMETCFPFERTDPGY